MSKIERKTLTFPPKVTKAEFELWRSPEVFDGIAISHWWLTKGSVYGFRTPKQNEAIASLYWAYCKRHGGHTQRDCQQNFLLAHIVPYIKRKRANKIVIHACLSPTTFDRSDTVDNLEMILAGAYSKMLSPQQFQKRTGKLLGPPKLNKAELKIYRDFENRILDSAAQKFPDEAAAASEAIRIWKELCKKCRHGGYEKENRALDLLSYEALTALHQCYSVAWMFFLELIKRQEPLTDENAYFLAFWHTDRRIEIPGAPADSHLFHGHVFSLHGGTGLFLKTETGRKLVGEWLRKPIKKASFYRLLNGLYNCLYYYKGLLDDHADFRKNQPGSYENTDHLDAYSFAQSKSEDEDDDSDDDDDAEDE
ncbi:MAG: hypothetical protein WCT04_26990 [Planctomycetota bacterium]